MQRATCEMLVSAFSVLTDICLLELIYTGLILDFSMKGSADAARNAGLSECGG